MPRILMTGCCTHNATLSTDGSAGVVEPEGAYHDVHAACSTAFLLSLEPPGNGQVPLATGGTARFGTSSARAFPRAVASVGRSIPPMALLPPVRQRRRTASNRACRRAWPSPMHREAGAAIDHLGRCCTPRSTRHVVSNGRAEAVDQAISPIRPVEASMTPPLNTGLPGNGLVPAVASLNPAARERPRGCRWFR